MDRLSINIGNQANDGQGDKIRDAFVKINDNFSAFVVQAFTGPQVKRHASPTPVIDIHT